MVLKHEPFVYPFVRIIIAYSLYVIIDVIYVCLPIVASNTYCVVALFFFVFVYPMLPVYPFTPLRKLNLRP